MCFQLYVNIQCFMMSFTKHFTLTCTHNTHSYLRRTWHANMPTKVTNPIRIQYTSNTRAFGTDKRLHEYAFFLSSERPPRHSLRACLRTHLAFPSFVSTCMLSTVCGRNVIVCVHAGTRANYSSWRPKRKRFSIGSSSNAIAVQCR